MNMQSFHHLWRSLPRPVRIAILAVGDIALIGIGLCIFALFHHVIPREEVASGIVSQRQSVPQNISVQQTAVPESIPESQETVAEQPTAEPVVQADPVGYFGTKFADKFTDGEVISKLLDDGTGIYQSANLNLTGTTHQGYNSTYYVVDIYVKDIACLKTAMANDSYGRGQRQWPAEMAAATNAIAAINGDYYSARQEGTVLRNGVLYRDHLFGDVGVLYWDGSFESYNEMEYNLDSIMARGAYQIWNFGPMLLENGQPMTDFNSSVTKANPRTAIGYYEPGHYCFVVVDGRTKVSDGMTMEELSQLFYDLGCTEAYNLDGGQTSQLVWNGHVISKPYDGGRECSDIVLVAEP